MQQRGAACCRTPVAAPEPTPAEPVTPNIWLTIYPDNTIKVMFAGTEMGQGSSTATPMIMAEHLDADWDKVMVETVNFHDEAYGNPIFMNILYTAGSTNVMVYGEKMKVAGTQARKMLLSAAAAHWGVDVAELTTEPSVVVHAGSGQQMTYGEIVALGNFPTEVPQVEETEFKPASEFRYIGKPFPRRDVPAKSMGTAQYSIDTQVEGMVYAAVRRTPVEGESPVDIDDTETLAVPGVTDVIRLPYGVAVVGTTVEATRWGKDKLKVTWTEDSPSRNWNTDTQIEKYSELAQDLSVAGTKWTGDDEVETAMEGAVETFERLYTSEPAYHAQIEPMTATASVSEDGKSASIWIGTQSQTLTIWGAAELLETEAEKIDLHPLTMGGGFGRRTVLRQQYADDALYISREIGKPVKVIWTREDDVEAGLFRTAASQYMVAGFDADGKLTAMRHRVAAPTILETMNKHRWAASAGRDVITMLGSENSTYDIPSHRSEHVMADRESRVCAWRGVGTSYTKFAMESFIDEIAESKGIDPLEYRLQLCHDNPRMSKVLETVAEMADWSTAREEGVGLGIAISGYSSSLSAGVVELSIDPDTYAVNIHKFWGVGDAGYIISPENAHAQVEGNIVFGLSAVLKERVTLKDGVVQQSNFHDYPIMRMIEVPEIEVQVLSTDNKSTGVGELGLAMTGPAIANAIYSLTGKRIRHLPLTPDVVKAALEA